ncbi:hypothetical protein, partial [Neisseria gonorrhoeae]|uniref:hypothetical protein n=1 Tax=Neisseria gonorrhoeae TaxID=485 RepID=UPI003D15CBF9
GDGNGDVDFAVAFCLIELDGTGQTVKTADVGAGVEVVDGETDGWQGGLMKTAFVLIRIKAYCFAASIWMSMRTFLVIPALTR